MSATGQEQSVALSPKQTFNECSAVSPWRRVIYDVGCQRLLSAHLFN
jgi:hypothetical protein